MGVAGRKGTRIWSTRISWLGLACIVAAFVVALIRLHPTNFFGYTEDDSIYFSSAKGLAEGKGYVLPSFPGTPAATKYPVFYPWLLSWVWRLNPSFPSNLVDAMAMNAAFGVAFIVLAFLLLRRFEGIGEVEALLLTAFCALHPVLLFYSGNLLSEVPFAAMTLGAVLLAENALKACASTAVAICCGALVGLSMLTRVLGVPVAAGIALAFICSRAWRPLLWFSGTVLPFFAVLCLESVFAHRSLPPVTGAAASSPIWIHTWTYYTSYVNEWKQDVLSLPTLLRMLKVNSAVLAVSPATYFTSPLVRVDTISGVALLAVVAAGTLAGIIRQARQTRAKPIHFVLPFYACAVLLWSYPDANRFLIAFLPLFAVGLWVEAKHVLRMVRVAMISGTQSEKVFATGLGAIVLLISATVATNYFGRARAHAADLTQYRASLLPEKREAYAWISRFTDADARVVAYEDALQYLYTGREATRPFTFTAAEFYSPNLLEDDLAHLVDVPAAIGAEYWVFSDDDLQFEWHGAYTRGRARMQVLEGVFPLVFRSQQGHVRIYSIRCLREPERRLVAREEFFLPATDACRLLGQSGGNPLSSD